MDPNMALKSIRKLARQIRDDLDVYGHAQPHEADRLAHLIESLDEWISHGGFLPLDWIENRERRAEIEGKLAEQARASTYTRSKK